MPHLALGIYIVTNDIPEFISLRLLLEMARWGDDIYHVTQAIWSGRVGVLAFMPIDPSPDCWFYFFFSRPLVCFVFALSFIFYFSLAPVQEKKQINSKNICMFAKCSGIQKIHYILNFFEFWNDFELEKSSLIPIIFVNLKKVWEI